MSRIQSATDLLSGRVTGDDLWTSETDLLSGRTVGDDLWTSEDVVARYATPGHIYRGRSTTVQDHWSRRDHPVVGTRPSSLDPTRALQSPVSETVSVTGTGLGS